jgi:hypothetical protein
MVLEVQFLDGNATILWFPVTSVGNCWVPVNQVGVLPAVLGVNGAPVWEPCPGKFNKSGSREGYCSGPQQSVASFLVTGSHSSP